MTSTVTVEARQSRTSARKAKHLKTLWGRQKSARKSPGMRAVQGFFWLGFGLLGWVALATFFFVGIYEFPETGAQEIRPLRATER